MNSAGTPTQGKSPFPEEAPRVFIITPVFNRIEQTRAYLRSLKRITYPHAQLVIVDDGSSDGTADMLAQEHPEVTVLRGDGDLWWAGGTNLGVSHALAEGADYVLTLNNDSLMEPDFLTRLVETAEAHPRSIVGSTIYHQHDPDQLWAVGGYMDWGQFVLFNLHYAGQPASVMEEAGLAHPFEVDMVCGNGTLIPADCFREVGLYDNDGFPQYHADTEFCLRARARGGYRVLVALDAVIYNDSHSIGGAEVHHVWDQLTSIRSHFNLRLYFRILKYCPGGATQRIRMHLVYAWMFARIIVGRVWLPWLLRPLRSLRARA